MRQKFELDNAIRKIWATLRWVWLGVLTYCALSLLIHPDLVLDQTQPVMGAFYGQF